MHPLKRVIEKNNYSYEDIGKIIGVSKQGVYNIINDLSMPSAKTLLNILIYFKLDITPLELYIYYFHKK